MIDPRMNHLTEAELHAAAEGQLEAPGASLVEAHLETCATCRADVERLRVLLEHAATLPRDVEPPADLWPGIRERVQSSRVAPLQRGIPRRAWAWFAAAAVLLVIASSALTTFILRGGDQPVAAGHDETRSLDTVGTVFHTVNAEYERMDRELAAQLASQRDKLMPETIEKVERNLAIIDQAIDEIRQALAEDPNNRALQQLLKASYGQKAALLRQVSQS